MAGVLFIRDGWIPPWKGSATLEESVIYLRYRISRAYSGKSVYRKGLTNEFETNE